MKRRRLERRLARRKGRAISPLEIENRRMRSTTVWESDAEGKLRHRRALPQFEMTRP